MTTVAALREGGPTLLPYMTAPGPVAPAWRTDGSFTLFVRASAGSPEVRSPAEDPSVSAGTDTRPGDAEPLRYGRAGRRPSAGGGRAVRPAVARPAQALRTEAARFPEGAFGLVRVSGSAADPGNLTFSDHDVPVAAAEPAGEILGLDAPGG
ncbi:hypothetical protein GCM10010259_05630 [Streptomyces daghestanicus]|nr:hypothetical protein GCM10010259_05630 [Streptomyces daghestanicus]